MNIPKRKPVISAIAAIGKNRELGKGGELVWRVSDDLKRVKQLTMGHPLIMGRKTYESIGKPLPGRTNIVVTRDDTYEAPGCVVMHSLEEALKEARAIEDMEIFIFGGAQIYTEALPYTDRLYLTVVNDTDSEADSFFPKYDEFTQPDSPAGFTKVVERKEHAQDNLSYTWLTLERE